MKKYFIHDGKQSTGPFSKKELKELEITGVTPVWFDGMEKWKYANDIEEIKDIIAIEPIDIEKEEHISSHKGRVKKTKVKILGLSKKYFWLACFVVFFILFTISFNIIQNERSRELEAKNEKTYFENEQFLLQQREIEKQKKLLEEKSREEDRRLRNEKKEKITNRLEAIGMETAIAKEKLEMLTEKLIRVSGFKVFRKKKEKEDEINAIEKKIIDLEKEINDLEIESSQLKLELEKDNALIETK